MTENATHLLSLRVQKWTGEERQRPGFVGPKDRFTDHYQGTIEDCDALAKSYGAPTFTGEIRPTETMPFHDRFYRESKPDGGYTEVTCHAQPIEVTNRSEWVRGLPTVGEIWSPEQLRCPHARTGGCWACQDETNPHAEFAQELFDAAEKLSKKDGVE